MQFATVAMRLVITVGIFVGGMQMYRTLVTQLGNNPMIPALTSQEEVQIDNQGVLEEIMSTEAIAQMQENLQQLSQNMR